MEKTKDKEKQAVLILLEALPPEPWYMFFQSSTTVWGENTSRDRTLTLYYLNSKTAGIAFESDHISLSRRIPAAAMAALHRYQEVKSHCFKDHYAANHPHFEVSSKENSAPVITLHRLSEYLWLPTPKEPPILVTHFLERLVCTT